MACSAINDTTSSDLAHYVVWPVVAGRPGRAHAGFAKPTDGRENSRRCAHSIDALIIWSGLSPLIVHARGPEVLDENDIRLQ